MSEIKSLSILEQAIIKGKLSIAKDRRAYIQSNNYRSTLFDPSLNGYSPTDEISHPTPQQKQDAHYVGHIDYVIIYTMFMAPDTTLGWILPNKEEIRRVEQDLTRTLLAMRTINIHTSEDGDCVIIAHGSENKRIVLATDFNVIRQKVCRPGDAILPEDTVIDERTAYYLKGYAIAIIPRKF
jgi:hypothetical protein